MDESAKALVEITGEIRNIMDGIETVKEKQDLLGEDISKIKEAVYHPDIGLYARLRELDARLKDAERFKSFASKLFWTLGTGLATIFAVLLKQQFMGP